MAIWCGKKFIGNRVFKTRFPVFTWSFLLLCSSMGSFLLRAWVLLRVLLWDPFFFVLGFFFVFFHGFLFSSCSFFNFFRSLLCTFYSHVNCSSSSSMGSSLHLLSSSISSNLHYVLQILLFKTRVPCGKKISMSAIKTWGFKARFLHWTRASKARDVTLLNSF